MKTKLIMFIICLGGLFLSCAHVEKQTREEWIIAQTHNFSGITPKQVLVASEKIFNLSDESDFNFSYKQEELVARRSWTFYAILSFSTGTDTWTIKTKKINGTTEVNIDLEISASQFGGYSSKSGPLHTSDYELFWARLEYLLGLRNDWMTCDQFDKINPYSSHGLLSGLCANYTENKNP